MKNNKILSTKVKRDELTKAAGPRRPLRKPQGKPLPPSSPAKPPTRNKPTQPSQPSKPIGK